HDRFFSIEAGPVMARHRLAISWHGQDKQPFAEEVREVTVYHVPGGQLIEFASTLRPTDGSVRLDGDPQHAGLHFRADNEVFAKASGQTIFVRPDGVGQPGETRHWDPDTLQGPSIFRGTPCPSFSSLSATPSPISIIPRTRNRRAKANASM